MASKQELDTCYMTTAYAHAKLSKAKRLQVGATLVTSTGVTISGVNGLPKQLGNECEVVVPEEYDADFRSWMPEQTITKREVIHAELSCLIKCAKEGVSTMGATLYTTHSCCIPCASMLIAAGIKEVVYAEEYRDTGGLDILKQGDVAVRKYES